MVRIQSQQGPTVSSPALHPRKAPVSERLLAARERWDYWKDMVLAPVDAKASGDPVAFKARRTVSEMAHATLIETTGTPMSMHRPQSRIARDGIDHACLVVMVEGSGVLDQMTRPQDVVRSGDLILYDLGRPYTGAPLEPYRELRLYVPRNAFATRVGHIETLSGLTLRGGTGLVDLFTGYLQSYAASLPNLDARQADAGMDGVLHLLSGLVGTSPGASGDHGDSLERDSLLALALRHIEALLGNPRFDVAMLARAVGVSRSRLYDTFAAHGGIASAIRDARLERARLRLAAPKERYRTLEEIAFSCGFSDYPTFSRSFRRRFGIPPNYARLQALGHGR